MALDLALAALADPTRRKIIEELTRSPREAGKLAAVFPISRPGVARHVRVLREAGLVEAQTRGRCRIYRLSPKGLAEIKTWMDRTAKMWEEALTSFRSFAEKETL